MFDVAAIATGIKTAGAIGKVGLWGWRVLTWIPWFRDRYIRDYPPLTYVTFEIQDDVVTLRHGVLQVPVVVKNSTHFAVHVKRAALLISHPETGQWVQIDTGDMGVLRGGTGVRRIPAVSLPYPWMKRIDGEPQGYTEAVVVTVTGVAFGDPYADAVVVPAGGVPIRHIKLQKAV